MTRFASRNTRLAAVLGAAALAAAILVGASQVGARDEKSVAEAAPAPAAEPLLAGASDALTAALAVLALLRLRVTGSREPR